MCLSSHVRTSPSFSAGASATSFKRWGHTSQTSHPDPDALRASLTPNAAAPATRHRRPSRSSCGSACCTPHTHPRSRRLEPGGRLGRGCGEDESGPPLASSRLRSLDASGQVRQLAELSALPSRTVALRRSRAALGRGRLLALAPDRGLQVGKAHGAPPHERRSVARAARRRSRRDSSPTVVLPSPPLDVPPSLASRSWLASSACPSASSSSPPTAPPSL